MILLLSTYEIKTLIDNTIQPGGSLYDKDYQEHGIALYGSVLNTILTAKGGDVTSSIKNIICQGLTRLLRAEIDIGRKVNMAWTLRYTLDARLMK